MIGYLLLAIFSLFILNLWIWLFDNIFSFADKKKVWISIIIMGLFAGIGMLAYPSLLKLIGLNSFNFVNIENIFDIKVTLVFVGYLIVLSLVLKLVFQNKNTSLYIKSLSLFVIMFITASYIGINTFTKAMMIYYIFVAFGEEILKYVAGLNFFEKRRYSDNDLLIFCILSGIGFAFVENIAYIIGGVAGQGLTKIITIGSTILITRGIIGFIVHILFSGNLGLIVSKNINKSEIKGVLIGIIIAVGLHFGYDLMLSFGYKIIVAVFLLMGYIWVSYLFWRSDRIYISDGLQSLN